MCSASTSNHNKLLPEDSSHVGPRAIRNFTTTTLQHKSSCSVNDPNNNIAEDDDDEDYESDPDNNFNKTRTFHQDVNEALNSLLWQPYEYRNNVFNTTNNNGSSSSNSRCGNSASDLHQQLEMVNNPRPTSRKKTSSSNKNNNPQRCCCYEEESESRELVLLPHLANANRLTVLGSETDVSCKECVVVEQRVSCSSTSDANSSAVLWNEIINMRVEINSNNNNPLINANVVGLPFPTNHARNSSEPCNNNYNTSGGVQPVVTVSHARHTSTPVVNCANIVSILSHQRHTTHLNHNNNNNLSNDAVANNFNAPAVAAAAAARSTSVPPKTDPRANFYRAVPVTTVLTSNKNSNVTEVPTIQCDLGNNVSNVNIVQANLSVISNNPVPEAAAITAVAVSQPVMMTTAAATTSSGITRTFTSTEAQTEDTTATVASMTTATSVRALGREQRRRERRERRHQRRMLINGEQHQRLPDLLSNHMPPPYSPPPPQLPNGALMPVVPGINRTVLPNSVVVPFPPPVITGGQVPLVQNGASVGVAAVSMPPPTTGFRIPFPSPGFRRYSLRSRYSEDHPKSCCAFLIWKPGSLRWFIALIAVVAVCCVLVGTALGAMRPAGRDHLTVSLLMIGVGIVLVTVSGIAWKLTSHDSSTCRGMLGLGSTESVDTCPRRFIPRLPPSYGRPHHPYAAMIYPEFQYRPPPPSYQASMQEYRLRLLLLDRASNHPAQNGPSPPPTYRSYAGSLLRANLSNGREPNQSEYSFPPSYRSHTSTLRPATITSAIIHTREHSLTLSDSHHSPSPNHLTSNSNDIALDNITIDSLKLVPECGDITTPVKMLLRGSSCNALDGIKDGNLVTIVQTSDQSPVIVTVSGCSQNDVGSTVQITDHLPTEMEILAHL